MSYFSRRKNIFFTTVNIGFISTFTGCVFLWFSLKIGLLLVLTPPILGIIFGCLAMAFGAAYDVFGDDLLKVIPDKIGDSKANNKSFPTSRVSASRTLTPEQYYFYLQEASLTELETDNIDPKTYLKIKSL